jgi:N-hydroxyarylamine O-acetyltransferase
MDTERVRAYLDRLGVDEVPAPTVDALRELHARHLERIPFENLSIHLGEEISLDEAALVAKLLDRHRGGFCYELNGAFSALLRSLGYAVSLLAARVHGADGLGPPFDHMALRVDLDEPWLADVGFGDSHRHPLRLDDRGEQTDPVGTFRLAAAPAGELDLLRDGAPRFRLDPTPHPLVAFAGACRYHQAESHFTERIVCSRATPEGRVTISGQLIIVTSGDAKEERELDDDALLAAYREHFGIDLAAVPLVRGRQAP